MSRPVGVSEIQPARSAVDIVPNNDASFTRTRGLYIGTTGDIRIVMAKGATVTFVAITAGIIHPLSVVQVLATGTTATNIIGLF